VIARLDGGGARVCGDGLRGRVVRVGRRAFEGICATGSSVRDRYGAGGGYGPGAGQFKEELDSYHHPEGHAQGK
jgi:hypothetical protein